MMRFSILILFVLLISCGQASLPIVPNTPTATSLPPVITIVATLENATATVTLIPTMTGSPTPRHTPTPTPPPTATAIPDEIDADREPLLASTCATLPASECRALRILYNATRGDRWRGDYPGNAVSWYNSANPCDWYGITCENGRIIELQLNEIGLDGILPAELGNLTALQHLSVYKNQLRGGLPSSIGALIGLVSADFSNNQFSGGIPLYFGRMPQLEALNLNFNAFSGTLPSELATAPKLGWLDVSHNYLNGTIPSEYSNFDFFSAAGNNLRE